MNDKLKKMNLNTYTKIEKKIALKEVLSLLIKYFEFLNTPIYIICKKIQKMDSTFEKTKEIIDIFNKENYIIWLKKLEYDESIDTHFPESMFTINKFENKLKDYKEKFENAEMDNDYLDVYFEYFMEFYYIIYIFHKKSVLSSIEDLIEKAIDKKSKDYSITYLDALKQNDLMCVIGNTLQEIIECIQTIDIELQISNS